MRVQQGAVGAVVVDDTLVARFRVMEVVVGVGSNALLVMETAVVRDDPSILLCLHFDPIPWHLAFPGRVLPRP